MKVNHALRVFAPSLRKHEVIEWFNTNREVGWYKEDMDFSKKKEYLRILVNAPLVEIGGKRNYHLKKGNPYEG